MEIKNLGEMKLINDYFSFTKSEVRGLLIVLFIIMILIFIRIILRPESDGFNIIFHAPKESKECIPAKKSNMHLPAYNNDFKSPGENQTVYAETFDPNTALYDELLHRGFATFVAQRIIKYRLNGGRFQNANDLLKIYGIDTSLVCDLSEEIQIGSQFMYSKNEYKKSSSKKVQDLNRIDSLSLKQVPGIGSVLSARIVKYRDLLGGFYSCSQLCEVYGIDDSLSLKMASIFTVDTACIYKIDLNKASINELKRHPYLTYYQAKAIISYRKLIGPFESKKQLMENYLLSEIDYLKLAPYLTLN